MRILKILLIAVLCSPSVLAWDRVGHLVVDAIAWEHMSERARERAVELLRTAPADADLALPGLTSRDLFLRTGYWPDVVRDEAWPARKEKYDRPTWHYVNHFWRDDGTSVPEMETNGELIERLSSFDEVDSDPIELAWMLHLVGDIHQPLHSSARVTAREPEGDRGGNDFTLDDVESWGNLHAFWDSIQMRARRKRHSESYSGWVDRIAREIMTLHPPESLARELGVEGFENWSQAGAELAMRSAYPHYLVRGARPPPRYQDEVQEISDRQLALAGYRLAALMNDE